MKYRTTVDKAETLVSVISHAAPVSTSDIKRLLKAREVKVNGVRVGENMPLKVGDEVEFFVPSAFLGEEPRIIYEDENILVAYKPALTEVEPTLTRAFASGRDYIRPMHRLDRNTTGLVAFALDPISYEILYKAFSDRTVDKRYLAEVAGSDISSGVYTAYLFKDAKKGVCYVRPKPVAGSKKIVTGVNVLQRRAKSAIVEIELVTGRTHQIRAHLKYLGHPVIGDGKYGDGEVNKAFGATRQRLCAYKLTFHGLYGRLEYLNEKVFAIKANFID